MNTLFKNANIYDPMENKLSKANLAVEKDKISYIGKDIPSVEFDRVINAKNYVLMPGFKNAHAHTPMVILRSVADDMVLEDWLNTTIFPLEAKLTGEDVYYSTILGIMEYLKNGITACLDMYFLQEHEAKAFSDCGFRAILNASLTSSGESDEEEKAYKRILEEHEKFYNYSSFVTYVPGAHSTYTTTDSLLRGISRAIREIKRPFYTHMNETSFEAANAKKKTALYNVEYIDSLGLLDFGGGIFHGVHMQESELDILIKRGVGIGLNPCSNAKLNSGMADFCHYKDRGVILAIGTDGASSNNSLDVMKEMWTLYSVNHIKYNSVTKPTPRDILYAATVGSSKLMNLEYCDVLEVGKKADIVAVDISDVNAVPFTDFAKFMCYSANPSNVKMTMIDGKILYENGKYNIGFDKKSIAKEVTNRLKRIRKKR